VGAIRWLLRALGSGPGLAVILGALGAGLVLGTLPDILQKAVEGRGWPVLPVLIGAAAFGVVLLASAHLWLNRRDGVGIVLFMPPEPGVHWSHGRLAAMAGHARRRHQTCFTVDVDELQPSLPRQERRRFAQRVIEARLNEDAPGGVVSSPVTFYMVCALPDAFDLGRELKFQVHERVSVHAEEAVAEPDSVQRLEPGRASASDSDGGGAAPVIPRASVAQTSEEPGKTVFTAVRVDSRLRRPPRGRWARRVDDLLTFQQRTYGSVPEEYVHRTALIVHLTRNVGVIEDASEVASTGLVCAADGRHRGYVLDARDPWRDGAPCGAAMVVDGPVGHLPDRQALYEAAVARIAQRWLAFLDQRAMVTGRPAEGLLFCSAPGSIAFALGAVLGRDTSIVPHRGDLARKTRPDQDSATGSPGGDDRAREESR
jgi:hypothetical protein